jgi:hypothetical protein
MQQFIIAQPRAQTKEFICFLTTYELGNKRNWGIFTSERISDGERQILESNALQSFRGHILAVEQVRQRSVQHVVHFTTGTAGAACRLIVAVAIDFGGSAVQLRRLHSALKQIHMQS